MKQQLLKWVIFALACYLLYAQLLEPQDTMVRFVQVLDALKGEGSVLLYLIFFLVFINWGIEAIKWKLLLASVNPMSIRSAFFSVLVGTALGLFTPNRTGEFVGRIIYLSPQNRVRGAFASALGSLSQLVVTIVVGTMCLGIFLLIGMPSPLTGQFVNRLLMVLAFSSGVIAMFVYFFPGILKRAVEILPVLNRWQEHADVLISFNRNEQTRILLLSFFRYCTFTGQFVLALLAMGVDLRVEILFLAVPIIYLINTLVPSIVLTELAIRSAVAVEIFRPMGVEAGSVVLASFMIWLFNLLMPAMLGALIFLFKGNLNLSITRGKE